MHTFHICIYWKCSTIKWAPTSFTSISCTIDTCFDFCLVHGFLFVAFMDQTSLQMKFHYRVSFKSSFTKTHFNSDQMLLNVFLVTFLWSARSKRKKNDYSGTHHYTDAMLSSLPANFWECKFNDMWLQSNDYWWWLMPGNENAHGVNRAVCKVLQSGAGERWRVQRVCKSPPAEPSRSSSAWSGALKKLCQLSMFKVIFSLVEKEETKFGLYFGNSSSSVNWTRRPYQTPRPASAVLLKGPGSVQILWAMEPSWRFYIGDCGELWAPQCLQREL